MYRIILASASPRRKEILNQVGIQFEVIVSHKEEVVTSKDPVAVVKELSLMKAEDVARQVDGPGIIIGADTVVAHNGVILGKPKSEAQACEMIERLQGNIHEVYTGVAILIKKDGEKDRVLNFHVGTKVEISSMSMEEIISYVATKEPFDKAGSYAIQGKFAPFVSKLEGDYYNVVGLPIAEIYRQLKMQNIDVL